MDTSTFNKKKNAKLVPSNVKLVKKPTIDVKNVPLPDYKDLNLIVLVNMVNGMITVSVEIVLTDVKPVIVPHMSVNLVQISEPQLQIVIVQLDSLMI